MDTPKVWTVKAALDWTRGFLERRADEHPRLSAEWLLCAATGLSRVELYVNYDRPLSSDELATLHDGVARRGRGEPLQYVTGEMGFRHIVLRCAPGVLIPRPETELLVEEVLAFLDAEAPAPAGEGTGKEAPVFGLADAADPVHRGDEPRTAEAGAEEGRPVEGNTDSGQPEEPEEPEEPPFVPRARVLEVGTGTGCVSLSIASERPGVGVVATDIAPEPVALATRNRDALGLARQVQIVQTDLAAGVEGADAHAFDVLVSNPPYIPTDQLKLLPREVGGFEPALALDGGPDGLDVFRRLVDLATHALRPGGLLACELHEDTLDAACALPQVRAAFTDVRYVRDLTGRPRIFLGRLARPAGQVA